MVTLLTHGDGVGGKGGWEIGRKNALERGGCARFVFTRSLIGAGARLTENTMRGGRLSLRPSSPEIL